jgi:hypothetical protein
MSTLQHFSETQKFTQKWIWALLLGGFFITAILAFDFWKNENPASNDNFYFVIGTVALSILSILFFTSLRLETTIDSKGIGLKFSPIHREYRFYPWQEIEKIHIRKYDAISEFGGWGIRIRPFKKSRAYNVRGTVGLQLELKSGHKILIGTSDPERMQKSLDHFLPERLKANI